METTIDDLKEILQDFCTHINTLGVVGTCIINEKENTILSPQITINIYLDGKGGVVARIESNGEKGFTSYKNTYIKK